MVDAPRARKIADRIKTLIAANLEQLVKDPALGFVTLTDVRVTNDLQNASVFYTVFGDERQREHTAQLLEKNKGRVRSFVGGQLGIRLTPTLEFFADAIPETAAHLEGLLREAKERDAAVAASAAGAVYAGDADPYRKPAEEETPIVLGAADDSVPGEFAAEEFEGERTVDAEEFEGEPLLDQEDIFEAADDDAGVDERL